MGIEGTLMVVGFLLAAYSIVANDAIQTLGTFLSSNSKRPWWVLWLFACSVLMAVFIYGWLVNNGDVSYGRLEKFPMPDGGLSWIYVVPPLVILVLTRFGVPVSTTFLILTVFAPGALFSMLTKSLMGYFVAFVVAIVVYKFVTHVIEKRFLETKHEPPPSYWIVLQWLSTGFLWSQWLIHDLANIFAYLPRQLDMTQLALALAVMLLLHAIIFYRRGGEIQQIVTSKTNTQDIRSATIIDFIYALVLLVFKEYSNMPMSTTWVFLGLLAGREFAISMNYQLRPLKQTGWLVLKDGFKATAGLLISIGLAFGLPAIQDLFSGSGKSAALSSQVEENESVTHHEPPPTEIHESGDNESEKKVEADNEMKPVNS